MPADQVILQSTAEGALALPSAADMQRQITDQIRALMLNMLPRETVDKLVDNAWKHFTTPQTIKTGDRYNEKIEERPSPLQQMFNSEMQTQIVAIVKEWGEEFRKAAYEDETVTAAIMERFRELSEAAGRGYMQSVTKAAVTMAVSECGRSCVCRGCHRFAPGGKSCPDCGSWND